MCGSLLTFQILNIIDKNLNLYLTPAYLSGSYLVKYTYVYLVYFISLYNFKKKIYCSFKIQAYIVIKIYNAYICKLM